MDRIQQIGLAHTVGPHEAIHLRPQFQIELAVIAEVEDTKAGKVKAHRSNKGTPGHRRSGGLQCGLPIEQRTGCKITRKTGIRPVHVAKKITFAGLESLTCEV